MFLSLDEALRTVPFRTDEGPYVPLNSWTSWPLREALSRAGVSGARLWIGRSMRVLVVVGLVWSTLAGPGFRGWSLAAALAAMALVLLAFRGFFRMTLARRLWPSVALFAVLEAAAFGFQHAGAHAPAIVLWCACAITAMERLPLSAAVPCSAAALGAYAVVNTDNWLTTVATTGGWRWRATSSGWTRRRAATPSGCWPRNARPVRPRRNRRRSPSGGGSHARSTMSSLTASAPSWCTWKRRGC